MPLIHDVSTDAADPPQFVALLDTRRACPNGAHYSGLNARAHLARYPHLATRRYNINASKVIDTALAFAQAAGWAIAGTDKAAGLIEATATTPIMRFKDDVVIRVRLLANGTRLDMRSASRVGKSDFGVNARRIGDFLRRLDGVLAPGK
jgi:uncharacterized protein (DUF1499 family)